MACSTCVRTPPAFERSPTIRPAASGFNEICVFITPFPLALAAQKALHRPSFLSGTLAEGLNSMCNGYSKRTRMGGMSPCGKSDGILTEGKSPRLQVKEIATPFQNPGAGRFRLTPDCVRWRASPVTIASRPPAARAMRFVVVNPTPWFMTSPNCLPGTRLQLTRGSSAVVIAAP